jgi:hypothetical protein
MPTVDALVAVALHTPPGAAVSVREDMAGASFQACDCLQKRLMMFPATSTHSTEPRQDTVDVQPDSTEIHKARALLHTVLTITYNPCLYAGLLPCMEEQS